MTERSDTPDGKPFDLLGTWTAAKQKAEAELAPIKDSYPPEVIRTLLKAMTCHNFWEMRK